VLPLLFSHIRWTGYALSANVNKKQKAELRKLAEYLPLLRASPLAAYIKTLELMAWVAGHGNGTVHTANEQMWDAIGRLPALEAVACTNMSLRADYLHRLDRPTLRRLKLHDCSFPWDDGLALPVLEYVDIKELDASKRPIAHSNFSSDGKDAGVYEGTAAAIAFVDSVLVLLRPEQLRTFKIETASSQSLNLFVKRLMAEPVLGHLTELDVLVHSEHDDVAPLLSRCPELETLTIRGPSNLGSTITNNLPKLKALNGRSPVTAG
jgi:hypothetical protein